MCELKRRIIDEKNGLNYTLVGDYYIPEMKANDSTFCNIGKYGRLHRNFLEEKYPMIYSDLVLADELYICLQVVQDRATKKLEALILELLLRNPAPDKTQDSLAWVQHMNSLKAQAEEIVLNEIVYSM